MKKDINYEVENVSLWNQIHERDSIIHDMEIELIRKNNEIIELKRQLRTKNRKRHEDDEFLTLDDGAKCVFWND